MANRATGETLPGLGVVRSVEQYHDTLQSIKNLEEARQKKEEEEKNLEEARQKKEEEEKKQEEARQKKKRKNKNQKKRTK
jgi:hypothetical protein